MDYFSNEHFEYKVNQYLSFLINRYHNNISIARDQEYARQVYLERWKKVQAEEYDSWSKTIADNFDSQYKLGHSIVVDIIESTREIISDAEAAEEYNKSRGRCLYRIYFRRIWNFNITIRIPLFRYIEVSEFPLAYNRLTNNKLDDISIFRALVKWRCLQLFDKFIISQETIPKEAAESLLPEPSTESGNAAILWTKPKTEFYKLVYALRDSGCVKGEIGRIMEKIAPALGIQLAKSWQSSVSKNMDYSNAGYNNAELFDELKNAFIKHVETRENNKRR